MESDTHVLIIGGGVNGTGLAYNLASRGVDTILVENNILASGATGRCGAGIRQQWSTEENIKLAMESVRIFEGLGEELGMDIEFRQGGYLVMIHDEEEKQKRMEHVSLQRSMGLEVRVLEGNEILDIVPYLDIEGIGAIGATFCPTDGHANPFKTVYAYAKAAQKLGARIYTHTEVKGIRTSNGRVVGAITNRGEIKARYIVNAAGAWSSRIAEMAGVTLPTRPFRHEIMATEPLKRLFDAMVISFRDGIYFSQMDTGQIVGGMGDPEERPGYNVASSFRFMQRYSWALTTYIPLLKKVNILRQWAGFYDVSPDARPIIGPTPGLEGFIQCNGFSGHGFMLSPMTTRLITELIVDGKPSMDISGLGLERFKDMAALETEANVVG